MKKYDIISSIFLLILGLIFIFIPDDIITTSLKIIGVIILIFSGIIIYNSIKNNKEEILYGILIIILGLVFLFNPEVIAGIIPFIIGLIITFKSTIKLQLIYKFKSIDSKEWKKMLIINLISLILGIILLFNPFKGATAILRIIGIFIVISSILDIINYYMSLPKKVKVIK